jgi:hypothetical protein
MEDDRSDLLPEGRHTLPHHSNPVGRIKRANKASPFCGGQGSCHKPQTLQAIFQEFLPQVLLEGY